MPNETPKPTSFNIHVSPTGMYQDTSTHTGATGWSIEAVGQATFLKVRDAKGALHWYGLTDGAVVEIEEVFG